jgi:tetratricopeptide (TPR) repeat protein/SAM-dependent methyltransferase
MTDGAEQLLTRAIELHGRGELAQAENLYRQVLRAVPAHLDSLNLLGVLAIQTGRHELAVEVIGKAIAVNDKVPDFHNNIGEAFRRMGNLERAVDHFTKAVDLEPRFLEAQQNLADVLKEQGRLDRAAATYLRILSVKPDFAAAHNGLGDLRRREGRLDQAIVHLQQASAAAPGSAQACLALALALRERGRLNDALAQFRRAVSLKQDYAEAHNNLGNALRETGQLAPAAAALSRAIELKPDYAFAHHNLGLVEFARGKPDQALRLARQALALGVGKEAKALIVRCLHARPALGESTELRPLLFQALSEPWGRSGELVGAVEHQIKAHPAVTRLIERIAGDHVSEKSLLDPPEFDALAADELLRCLLTWAPVSDAALERLLTRLRSALLECVTQGDGHALDEPRLDFISALARQCFLNDYVFMDSAAERAHVAELCRRLAAALRGRAAVPGQLLAAIACYQPLHALESADVLVMMDWPDALDAVVTQQVREPAAMGRYRAALPRLTAIEDEVSLLVRRQYEESPYPSWVRAAPGDEWPSVEAYLRNLFPMTSFDVQDSQAGEILVAGCGTGQQSVETAQRFPQAHVLAVDISLASLGYASMRAASVSNLEYAQADILRLGEIGRTFDLIEATGVLHHLGDPFAGWRVLLSILRPGGFMRLGLYSKLARGEVTTVCDWIAQRGYRASIDDIRRCRQELIALEPRDRFASVTRSPDFATTSACRDLLFHVQEQQLTLIEIERFLADERLRFLGFELESNVLEKYRTHFPSDAAMTNLALLHRFETENPHTFGGMYQFWIQKQN